MKIISIAIALILSVSASAFADKTVMVYRYWDWGKTPKRDDYEVEVLRTALEKTRNDYGDFAIVRHLESFSTSRARREVNRGELLNIQPGPWRPLEINANQLLERSIRINVPILNGLLGYRQLLIRKEDVEKFRTITQEPQLKALVAGQAHGWVDVDIYKHNGYKVDDNGNTDSLMSMLANKRFDYFPMSIAEIESILAANPDYSTKFTTAPGIIIYYPFPIIFYVSIHQPLLAERVDKGLRIMERDGSLTALFNKYYSQEINTIKKQKPHCFVLENPLLPDELKQKKPILFEN